MLKETQMLAVVKLQQGYSKNTERTFAAYPVEMGHVGSG